MTLDKVFDTLEKETGLKHLGGAHDQKSHGRRGGLGSGSGGREQSAISGKGTTASVARQIQEHFGGKKKKFSDANVVNLGSKTDIGSIKKKLGDIGAREIEKPSHAPVFEDSRYSLGNKTLRLLKGSGIKGGEEDRSLIVNS